MPQPVSEASSIAATAGEMEVRICDFDWQSTPLGVIAGWPQPILTLGRLMRDGGQPMFLAWGPELTMLYNDAYVPILGTKHPQALGRPLHEVWAEALDTVGPALAQVARGIPFHSDDLPVPVQRGPSPEIAHFSFSYTPVRDDGGAVIGLFCVVQDTTQGVLANQAVAQEKNRLAQLFEQGPSYMALLSGPEHRFELANAAYLRIAGSELLGQPFIEAFPGLDAQYLALLDGVFASGEAQGNWARASRPGPQTPAPGRRSISTSCSSRSRIRTARSAAYSSKAPTSPRAGTPRTRCAPARRSCAA